MFRGNPVRLLRQSNLAVSLILVSCVCVYRTSGEEVAERDPIQEAVIFHASFDKSPNADVGLGDKRIYTAESLERKKIVPGLQTDAVRWDSTGGRPQKAANGGALQFVSPTKQLVFFNGGKNVPYRDKAFRGTVAMWMKLSPKEDLPKGYVDPLQITDKKWNDASFFVDFDQSAARPFRLGVFSDFKFWNPNNRNFDDIPQTERPMVHVAKWPFDRERWTHVAFTWNGINSDEEAQCTLFIDGQAQGHIGGKQRFTWSPEKCVIMLGINYVGWIDELMIFNRALLDTEIQKLAASE